MLRGISVFAVSVALLACATSPTGQRQLQLVPEQQLAEMGATAYQQMKQETPVSQQANLRNYVLCVANAITREVPGGTQWEVTLFEDKAVNAFALPGGKIGVYTGLLNVAVNQHQLAAVLAHEVAHVLAEHPNARVSAAYATQAGLDIVQTLAGASSPGKQSLLGLLGVGAQYGILMPYGRAQETEADVLGINLMARAGFDPRESIALWRNMSKAGGAQPPELLSTHPSNETRIQRLQEELPVAMPVYERAANKPNCG
ncbi:MAG: M48 family metallopeptidase [Thiohalobacteraceae bacterium]